MIRVIIFGAIMLICVIYFLWDQKKKAGNNERLETLRRRARAQHRILDEIREKEVQRLVRRNVDRWRTESVPTTGAIFRPVLINPVDVNQPIEGQIKTQNIVSGRPELGQRRWEYHNDRWHSIPSQPPSVDFLTEDDMKI